MNKSVKYIAYFDVLQNQHENRDFPLSSANKINYIINAINENQIFIDVISPSVTLNKNVYPSKIIQLNSYTTLKLFKTFPYANKIRRIFSALSSRLQLIFYLLKTLKKSDTIIVYHSLAYLKIISVIKKICKFQLILEVEEIYGDVINSKNVVKKELDYFKKADGYIFSTELLNEKINAQNKPYAIIHGAYKSENIKKDKFNDGKIHCVYAGTFDIEKGVLSALNAASYLDFNYHMHIIGFGSEVEKKFLQEEIKRISKTSKCTITYDGLLSGDDYLSFIQSCHIGLCTQNANAEFNDTSFPSKIISYLANGLRVVSVKINSLEISAVNDLIYYYENDKINAIADAIKKVNLEDDYKVKCRETMKKLDNKFIHDINLLLTNIAIERNGHK